MDLKKLSKIADGFTAGDPESFNKFQKSIRNRKSLDEVYKLVREVISKDLLKRASKGILKWSGADRPGEEVAVGPATQAWDIFNRVHEIDEEYLADHELGETVAEFLGEEFDDDFDAEKYIATLKENPQLLANQGDPSQKYFLNIYDWNDLGDDVFVGFCDEDEIIEILVGGEGHAYGYSECPFGLYKTMVDAGLDPTKFQYLNTNEEIPELPTSEEVSEDVKDEIWDKAWDHYYTWGND